MLKNLSKRDLSILIGNVVDHFDTALYGFLAPVLAPIFFPKYDPIVQLILTYSMMATGIIARPIGAIAFGMLAKKRGPIIGLSYSLIGLAIATVLLGCIPSYGQIGALAPLSLILLRIVRGIFAAGESTIAKIYIMEDKTAQTARAVANIYQSSVMMGILLASSAATIVGYLPAITWLWRGCFWLGGIAGLAGYLLRNWNQQQQKPQFVAAQPEPLNLARVLRQIATNKLKLFAVAITTVFSYLTYSIPFVFLNSFVPLITDLDFATMLTFNTLFLILDIGILLISGRLLRHIEVRRLLILASAGVALLAAPLFGMLPNASLAIVLGVRLCFVVLGAIFVSPLNYWYSELFATKDKYLLIGIGNALGATTLGRMTPAICFSLWHTTSNIWYLGGYIMIIAMAAAIMVAVVRQRN